MSRELLDPILVASSAALRRQGLPRSYGTEANSRRATEMDVTMVGLQNAGKTSLLRVLSVSQTHCLIEPPKNANTEAVRKGAEFEIE